MRLIFSPYKSEYSCYYFPYQIWLLKEEKDDLANIFNLGFLPTRFKIGLFYLARSLRVRLRLFELSSENRRILKKTANFEFEVVAIKSFQFDLEKQKFCLDFCKKHLGKNIISLSSLKKIFSPHLSTHVFVWRKTPDRKIVGYVPVFVGTDFVYYWYAFYDSELLKTGLGARMMLETVCWSKKNDKDFIYLGTVYTRSSLYKTQFSGVEFFNGFCWSESLEELKYLIKKDEEGDSTELLKDEEFLQKFYQSSPQKIWQKFTKDYKGVTFVGTALSTS